MNVNVTRDTDQFLNIDGKEGSGNIGLKIEKESFKPQSDNLHFIMNDDVKNSFNEETNESVEEDNVDDYDYNQTDQNNSVVPESYQGQNEWGGQPLNGGLSYEEVEKEKAKHLSKLSRLSQNPQLTCRKLTYMNSLEEIKAEVYRCEKDLEIIQGVQLYRNGLVFLSSGMEFGLDKGMGWNTMNGWSHVVTKDVNNNNYDKVLEEIYEIWGGAGVMRPEFKLVMMLGSSAFNFHLQKLMAEKAFSNPSMMASFAQKMKGPSEDTDEILRRLDAESDVSSVVSEPPQPKKRGRKKKTA